MTEQKLFWSAKFENGNRSEITSCTIQSPGLWENKCIYPHVIANGLTSWVCEKPKDLPCSTITATTIDSKQISERIQELAKNIKPLFEG